MDGTFKFWRPHLTLARRRGFKSRGDGLKGRQNLPASFRLFTYYCHTPLKKPIWSSVRIPYRSRSYIKCAKVYGTLKLVEWLHFRTGYSLFQCSFSVCVIVCRVNTLDLTLKLNRPQKAGDDALKNLWFSIDVKKFEEAFSISDLIFDLETSVLHRSRLGLLA